MPKNSTPVPNGLFDKHLRNLKESELKVLLVIIRQTLGWKHKRRKRDWISTSFFETKTGLSKRSIGQAITTLQAKQLIWVTDHKGTVLTSPNDRKYTLRKFFALRTQSSEKSSSFVRKLRLQPPQNLRSTKETNTKETLQKIKKIRTDLHARWGKPQQLSSKDIS